MKTIFDMLEADHRKVEKLFKHCESKRITTREKEKTAQMIFQELEIHTAVEEGTLYPTLKEKTQSKEGKHDELRELVNEAYEEHKVAKLLIQEMRDMDADEEEFDAKLKVLKENIEHHVEEEEKELFPKAKKAVKEDMEQLTEAAKSLKEELQSETKGMSEKGGRKSGRKGHAANDQVHM